MTKKDLIKIIREAVRREVKKEVKKIFITEEISSSPSLMLDDIKPKQKDKVEKKYTKNEALNKVLNETAGGIQGGDRSEYPNLGGGIFNTDKMSELMGYGKPDEVKRDLVAVDTMKKAGVTSEQVPEHITNALTRDYSDLMKAINKDK
jgi:hypothetical protein